MIYTVIADYRKLVKEAVTSGKIYYFLPENVRERIEKPKSEEVMLSSMGGYLLLYHVVRFLFGKEDFNINYREDGKPEFVIHEGSLPITFNISHSGGLAAVCVCDEGYDVGVDIQESVDPERAERLGKRFLDFDINVKTELETVYLFGAFAPDGNCMFAEIPYRSLKKGDHCTDITDKWSLTEALVKCDGKGFCQRDNVLDSLEKMCSETVKISYKGKSYSVSTAAEKS